MRVVTGMHSRADFVTFLGALLSEVDQERLEHAHDSLELLEPHLLPLGDAPPHDHAHRLIPQSHAPTTPSTAQLRRRKCSVLGLGFDSVGVRAFASGAVSGQDITARMKK